MKEDEKANYLSKQDLEIEEKTEAVEIEKEQKEANKKRNGRVVKKKEINKGLIIVAIILTVIALSLVIFAIINKVNNNVYPNVYLSNINLSNKNKEEVRTLIEELNDRFGRKTVVIKYNGETLLELNPNAIDMTIDMNQTLLNVMNFGRKADVVTNNVDILKAIFSKKMIEPVYTYSDSKLTNIATDITIGIEGRVKDDAYTIDNESYNLIITRGVKGKDIVITDFKADILKMLEDNNTFEYNISLEERLPKTLDVDVVFADVNKEAKNAYIDDSVTPAVYHKHEIGVTFDKEELREVLEKEENKEEGKVIKFKLTTTKPEITIQDLTKDKYNDKISSYTSSYTSSDANRASNVALGAKMLNGTVIMPGETFSFNKTMGDCGLSSRGFKSAAVFKGAKVVQEIGGGICQISSTLYCAVLYANLEIIARSNHALPVGYVPASLDATVYYPYLDFKFKNNRNYPVKIVASTTPTRKLTIAIYGTKEEKEYEVELTSWITEYISPKVTKEYDSSLAEGKTKVVQNGVNGYKSVAYKTLKYNGKVISKELLSKDTYGAMAKIVKVGTKKSNVQIYEE